MKRFILFIFIFFSQIIYSETTFESNFLYTYLNFENAFLKLGGDYGTNFFPFLNTGYGGRETAFSGSFAAIADDIGTLEVNPAGTASLNNTEIFFSHSKMLGDVNYNTLAYTMRLNDLGLGLGVRTLYIPFTKYDKFGLDIGSGIINYTVITLNGAYNFFHSYDFFGLSVGTNVKLYMYTVPDTIALKQSKINAAFDIGILTRFSAAKFYNKVEKNLSFGLVVKNLGPFTDNEPPPTTAVVAVSYKPIEELLFTVDVGMLINYSDLTYKNWNVRTGIEWKFTKYTSLIAGFALKSSPSFSLGLNLNFEDFTINAIYNPDFADVAKFSVSASIKLGDMGRAKKDLMVKKMYSVALRLMNDGNYVEAKTLLEKLISYAPEFTPAKKSIKSVDKQIKIQQNLDDVMKKEQKLTY